MKYLKKSSIVQTETNEDEKYLGHGSWSHYGNKLARGFMLCSISYSLLLRSTVVQVVARVYVYFCSSSVCDCIVILSYNRTRKFYSDEIEEDSVHHVLVAIRLQRAQWWWCVHTTCGRHYRFDFDAYWSLRRWWLSSILPVLVVPQQQ